MSAPSPILGLLSDSHGDGGATQAAAAQLVARGATTLIHLGDLCGESVLDALAGWTGAQGGPVPTHLVWGNCDWPSGAQIRYAKGLGLKVHDEIGWLTLAGKKIAFHHGHLPHCQAQALAETADFLLHGHLHRRQDRQHGQTRVICAGSVSQPRDNLPPACALLWPASGQLEWVEVAPKHG